MGNRVFRGEGTNGDGVFGLIVMGIGVDEDGGGVGGKAC